MTLTYRLRKGSALTYAELDQNFKTLSDRLDAFEQQIQTQAMPELSIYREGTDLIVKDGQDRQLSRLSLPLPSFKPQGEWHPNRDYMPLDVVVFQGKSYICLQEHYSVDFDQQRELFQVLYDPIRADDSQREDDQASSHRKTKQLYQLPIYSAHSLPQPTRGALAYVIQDDGSESIFVCIKNDWHAVETRCLTRQPSSSSRDR